MRELQVLCIWGRPLRSSQRRWHVGVKCRDSIGLGRRREVAEKLLWLRTVKKLEDTWQKGKICTEQGDPSCRRDWKGELTEDRRDPWEIRWEGNTGLPAKVTDEVDRKAVCSFAVRASR